MTMRAAGSDWRAVGEQVLKKIDDVQMTWLNKNVDLEVGDLRAMSTEEIRKRFPWTPAPPEEPGGQLRSTVNDARLVRTFIWQTWLRIKAKELSPVRGNIRSCWYRYLEQFYRKHDLVKSDIGPPLLTAFWESSFYEALLWEFPLLAEQMAKSDGREESIIDLMGKSINGFVLKRIFRFQDEFEFQEPMDNHRKLGRKRASAILYTEKEGLWWLCQDVAGDSGVSAMASNGEPSLLTLEYFSDELKSKGIKKLQVGAFCDIDPWGYNIVKSIDGKFRFFGFDVTTYCLTTPDLFSQEVVEQSKRDFTDAVGSLKTMVDKWFAETNGFNGQKWGLHVDVVEDAVKRKRLNEWVSYIEKGAKPPSPWLIVVGSVEEP